MSSLLTHHLMTVEQVGGYQQRMATIHSQTRCYLWATVFKTRVLIRQNC